MSYHAYDINMNDEKMGEKLKLPELYGVIVY
jgi:hypothetical protein